MLIDTYRVFLNSRCKVGRQIESKDMNYAHIGNPVYTHIYVIQKRRRNLKFVIRQ